MKRIYVGIETKTDIYGVVEPTKILLHSVPYQIERIIHTTVITSTLCCYIVLISGKQNRLFRSDERWFIEELK